MLTQGTKRKLSLPDLSTAVGSTVRSKTPAAGLKKKKPSKEVFHFRLRGLAF